MLICKKVIKMGNTENTYQVFIKCFTFNHVNYIEDAMRGFVMQKTDFPYIAAIVDDASTDGEPKAIKRFLEKEFDMASAVQDETDDYVRVVAKHKTNVNCTFVVVFLKYNHYSIRKAKRLYVQEWMGNAKYIALCEGDDYWTDPYKLQKQVDFMESNPEYIACFHNAKVDCDGRLSLFNRLNEKKVLTTEDLIKRKWFISTQTLLYRNVPIEYPTWTKGVVNGDYFLELLLAKDGKFRYLDDVMAVYRRHEGSISDGLNRNQVMMYDKLIFLLQNMKVLYGGKCSAAFDESIANYQKQKEEVERMIKHPYLKFFKKSFYKRMIRKMLGK